uniref:Uncharacterized protein n=1 Tax=viral metagenome TaxID=1070528 RepID=A0A6C0JSX9_9ZZZZ
MSLLVIVETRAEEGWDICASITQGDEVRLCKVGATRTELVTSYTINTGVTEEPGIVSSTYVKSTETQDQVYRLILEDSELNSGEVVDLSHYTNLRILSVFNTKDCRVGGKLRGARLEKLWIDHVEEGADLSGIEYEKFGCYIFPGAERMPTRIHAHWGMKLGYNPESHSLVEEVVVTMRPGSSTYLREIAKLPNLLSLHVTIAPSYLRSCTKGSPSWNVHLPNVKYLYINHSSRDGSNVELYLGQYTGLETLELAYFKSKTITLVDPPPTLFRIKGGFSSLTSIPDSVTTICGEKMEKAGELATEVLILVQTGQAPNVSRVEVEDERFPGHTLFAVDFRRVWSKAKSARK